MNFLSFNTKTEQAELVFDSKPDARVIASLKHLGWRWDARGKCWHLAEPRSFEIVGGCFTPIQDGARQALLFAAGAIGSTSEQADRVLKDLEQQAHINGTRGMERALGIE